MSNTQLETYLHEHIPLSAAMGIRVLEASSLQVILRAPFKPNINHKKTVFGGSLHAVSTLACWCLMYMHTNEIPSAEVVITQSDIDYLLPVTSDFQAQCQLPDQKSWKRFIDIYKLKGKSRIILHSTIHQNDRLAVSFTGTFAAINP